MLWPLAYLLAFLAGSFPTGLLIGRLHGIDIRKHGSGNIGATNVGRILGAKAWLACFTIDLLKGLIPTLIMGWWAGLLGAWVVEPAHALLWLIGMVMPMLGHMFPPWLKFKGGKGVATGLGTVLAVYPTLTLAAGASLIVFIIALARWRYVSLGSMLAGAILPIVVMIEFGAIYSKREQMFPVPGEYWWQTALIYLAFTIAVATLVIVRHKANIGRIRAGTEPKVGEKKRAAG